MKLSVIILNIPWTLVGFLYGLLSLPKRIKIKRVRDAPIILMDVERLWLNEIFLRRRVK